MDGESHTWPTGRLADWLTRVLYISFAYGFYVIIVFYFWIDLGHNRGSTELTAVSSGLSAAIDPTIPLKGAAPGR